MKAFLRSRAGRGTIAVYLAGLLLSWPPALSWLVAIILLLVALRQFWDSFHELDDATADREQEPVQGLSTLAVADGGSSTPFDVNAAMAAIAASPSDTPQRRSH